MIRPKNSKGFTVMEVLMVILILTIAGLGGWYVYTKNQTNTPSNSKADNHSSTEVISDNAVVSQSPGVFDSDDIGFKLEYPESWGDMTVQRDVGMEEKGMRYSFKFSKNSKYYAQAITPDYNRGGVGGPCYFVVGDPFERFDASRTDNYFVDVFLNEDNLSGAVVGSALTEESGFDETYCSPIAEVRIKMPSTSKVSTVTVYYLDDSKELRNGKTDIDKYFANPSEYIPVEDKANLINVARSVTES